MSRDIKEPIIRPEKIHFARVRAVNERCVDEGGDLVQLLSWAEGQLTWEGAGNLDANWFACCAVHCWIVRVVLGHWDWVALGV
jgi:hypothetical protein